MNNFKNKLILSLVLVTMIFTLTACGGHSVEKAKTKIENYLYEKYGEEFVVDRIGTREYKGQEEYVARIYPKSIIGTNKEGDKYYYGSASVDKLSFGKLDEPGDSYGLIKINIGAEEYLLSKAKELFGERVLLKAEVKYKKKEKNGFYAWYKSPDFLKALQELKEYPEKRRIELELYIYVFDRIEDKAEKELRRKQIFDYVQYLKKEGLFKYLEMGVIFIDERVLAPSYDDYRVKVRVSDKVKKVIDGESVDLPSMELRKEMSKVLQKEIEGMSEEEMLSRMGEIRKSELSYDYLEKYNASHYGLIYSAGILEVKYKSSYEKYKKNNTLEHYYYKDSSEVKIGRNLEYSYIK